MLSVLGALLVTLGALVLALRGLRRLERVGRGRSSGLLEVVERIQMGPKHAIAVVRAKDRLLLVGMGDSGVRFLAEMGAAETDRRPVAAATPPATWRRFIGHVALLLALAAPGAAIAPATAVAQEMTVPPPSQAQAVKPQPPRPRVESPLPPRVQLQIGNGSGDLKLNGSVGLVLFLGALTLLPALLMLATSFTRIVIVLHFLRSALGTQATPPTQLLVAISLILTGLVMQPVINRINAEALQPYFAGRIDQAEAYEAALVPLREFMLANTRQQDLDAFAEMAALPDSSSIDAVPTTTIVSAFVTSELRTAFQMGFVIFLPFIVVDLVVASVLMSMGMFMLPPQMVSLPFKLLLFVLADGWTLVVRNLVASFHV